MSLFAEISPSLLESGVRVRFQATGGSMRPFIRGGDTVMVEPADISRAKIGDVMFCRRRNGFQVHRVIRRLKKGAFEALIVKGDALPGGGEIVFNGDVLGRVIGVERAGRRRELDSALGCAANTMALFFSYFVSLAYPLLGPVRRGARILARGIVSNLQKSGGYRACVRKWVSRGVSLDRVKEDDLYALACFYEYDRTPNFLELTFALKQDIASLDARPLFIAAKKGLRIIGSVWAGPLPDQTPEPDIWWVTGLLVGWPFRGCGIARQLMDRACWAAVRAGAKAVRLYAFADRPHHIALYRSLGFERYSGPVAGKKMEEETVQTGRRRILFEKIL